MRERWARWTAVAGCLGALGYGGLKALWAVGAMFGVDDPGQLHPAGEPDALWAIENFGTVGLAALAALILIALVTPIGTVVPRPVLRTLGWLGTVMVIPGAAGLAMILDYVVGSHIFGGPSLGGIAPLTYVFVYACFLTLGLAFFATSLLTLRRHAQ